MSKPQRGNVPNGAIDITRPLMTRDGVLVDRVERLPGPEHEFVLFGVLHGEDQHWRANGSIALDGRICDSDLIYKD